jgi:cystathionine gamma-lyase
MHDGTAAVHAGFDDPGQGRPMRDGPVFAAPYRHSGDPQAGGLTYARFANPTWTAYEAALAQLEGGPCLVFPSGMAAASAVLFSTLAAGDTVVLPSDGYNTLRAIGETHLSKMGVTVRTAPTADDAQRQLLEGARLLWLETPSNPGLDVCDIRALVAAAHDAGALVAVDNTTATVMGQRPLALGADFSVCSDTKATTGHSDLVLGHVAARDEALLGPVLTWRTQVGAIAGPMEVWLAHRSLPTLHLRLRQQCENALVIATALRAHPAVSGCRYPGLTDDPSHAVASQQMTHFGPVVNFTLASAQIADRWIDALHLVSPATSFGGVHSMAERRGRWGSDDVAPGFIRLSVGIEDVRDLVDDIIGALDLAAS